MSICRTRPPALNNHPNQCGREPLTRARLPRTVVRGGSGEKQLEQVRFGHPGKEASSGKPEEGDRHSHAYPRSHRNGNIRGGCIKKRNTTEYTRSSWASTGLNWVSEVHTNDWRADDGGSAVEKGEFFQDTKHP